MPTQTIQDIAKKIARDRSKWITKQLKKVLPNRIFCLCRSTDEDDIAEVQAYIEEEKLRIDVTPLDAKFYKAGRLIATWRAQVNFTPDPQVIPVHSPIVITDGQ